jgi:hypothetical protein
MPFLDNNMRKAQGKAGRRNLGVQVLSLTGLPVYVDIFYLE